MSMSFEDPVNSEAFEKIMNTFGNKVVANDRKTFLLNAIDVLNQRVMTEIANAAKQPATVELCGDGDIKTMSDGTRYRVTPNGWQKIE